MPGLVADSSEMRWANDAPPMDGLCCAVAIEDSSTGLGMRLAFASSMDLGMEEAKDRDGRRPDT